MLIWVRICGYGSPVNFTVTPGLSFSNCLISGGTVLSPLNPSHVMVLLPPPVAACGPDEHPASETVATTARAAIAPKTLLH